MEKQEWELEKGKRLKRRVNIQLNLAFLGALILFSLYAFNFANGSFVLATCLCLVFWGAVANSFYNLQTGKAFGNKTARYLEAFEQDRLGEQKWRKKKRLETIIFTVMSLVFTVCLVVIDWNAFVIDSYNDILPLMGSWLGLTIGQLIMAVDL